MVLTPMGLLFERRRLPCTIGRSGVVAAEAKCEGDGATPSGVHHVEGGFYRPDRLSRAVVPEWLDPIGPGDLWSDDPRDPAYNAAVTAPHGFGHEVLRRADPLYDLVLVLDWNRRPAVPGRGSAIFIHTWRRPAFPTAGCVALDRKSVV